MNTIKIALIGVGYIADYHARGLQTIPNVEIVCVVSKHIESAKKFAVKYGIKEAYTDISKVIENSEIDGVIVSTPNQFHAPYAISFLESGKDVFLEKPMGMNPKEGHEIDDAAKANKRLVMVGHMWRFDIDTNYIKELGT